MSLTIAAGRVACCPDCGTPYEAHPDVSREWGYPVYHCPTCTADSNEEDQ